MTGFLSNVLALAYREATVMRHDRAFMGMMVAQPIVMLVLLGAVLSTQPWNVSWVVIDRSGTELSRRLVAEIEATGRFEEPQRVQSLEEGRRRLRSGDALLLLVIPSELRREAERSQAEVQLLLDGADPLTAARAAGLVTGVASRVGVEASLPERVERLPENRSSGSFAIRARFWFNATLADRDFFLATLAGMLLTNLCLSVTSGGLVAERESGTFEQTLSLPTSPLEMVLGKILPYVGASYGVLLLAFLGAGLVFGVWPSGSIVGLGLLTLPFVLASLSIGVLISTIARTSTQAVFLTTFSILPSMVLSGVLFPYQLMPSGIREIGAVIPLRWYQIGLRRLVTRGGDLSDVIEPLLALWLLFGLLLLLIRFRLRPRLA
ncbi:putative multidrug ABC transporter permease YbhS [Myxococcaceae bacterium]|jgi:ABC-2 type transport system permease protein|nr:putative multidrug ABC transporter permease YbhS [Myxococcaceae bacterium]